MVFSKQYLDLKLEFSERLKIDARKLESAYSAVRRLGALPNDSQKSSFETASFEDQGLSNQESADMLADHFSRISQEFDPDNIDLLPPNVRSELSKGRLEQAGPSLEEHEVFTKIKQAKKTKS